MKIAPYLKSNPVIKELAEWFKQSSGRDDFYLGIGKDGQAFIRIEGVEVTYKSAINFIKEKQQKLNLRFR